MEFSFPHFPQIIQEFEFVARYARVNAKQDAFQRLLDIQVKDKFMACTFLSFKHRDSSLVLPKKCILSNLSCTCLRLLY